MNTLRFGRLALIVGAAALLSACGGSQPFPVTASGAGFVGSALKTHSRTFNYTGAEQTFKVPRRVKSITVDAYGGGTSVNGKQHAFGGRTMATLPVTPGETLYVFVGGDGTTGFNGGGASGGGSSCYPGFGAGASDVREHSDGLGNRVLVAGGAGGNEGVVGGKGGGPIGGTGRGGAGKSGYGGLGGTQSQGGAGGDGGKYYGKPGNAGALGVGGSGGPGGPSSPYIICGAGGGGGYYGGGGGGSSGGGSIAGGRGGGGGGGGSSYTEPNAKNVTLWQGWKTATGDGSVVLSW